MRDVMAGMKAVIYRRTTSNSVRQLKIGQVTGSCVFFHPPKGQVGGAKFRVRFSGGLNWVGGRCI